MTNQKLIEKAFEIRKSAYTPYSHFKVGAALLTKSGKVYTGCNIENASYSPTVCAERVAFFKAISENETEFDKIAICGAHEGSLTFDITSPCGVCRQVMAEFCDKDSFKILLATSEDSYEEYTLNDLLPHTFDKSSLH